MIINKEVMIEAIRELGHVRVDEVQGVILVRNYDFETTITIKPVYTGNTITRVRTAVYLGVYYEHDHNVKEYKSLVGLINYIATHIPLSETDIYKCKNDRVAKNRFKELLQRDISENNVDYGIYGDVIIAVTRLGYYFIKITVVNGEFSAEVKSCFNGMVFDIDNVSDIAELQSLLHNKGVL